MTLERVPEHGHLTLAPKSGTPRALIELAALARMGPSVPFCYAVLRTT